MSTTFARRCLLLALTVLPSGCTFGSDAPVTMRVTLTAMHAAALAAPQATADSADRPYLLVSVVGPGARTAVVRVPQTGELRIHHGEVLRELPLTDVRLSPGDTVRILISVLEGPTARGVDSTATAAASIAALGTPGAAAARALASAFGPIVRSGARWLGSASLRLTDVRGTVYSHGFECIETCGVLSGATDTPLHAPFVEPNVGAVELSGGRAKYHVQLNAQTQ